MTNEIEAAKSKLAAQMEKVLKELEALKQEAEDLNDAIDDKNDLAPLMSLVETAGDAVECLQYDYFEVNALTEKISKRKFIKNGYDRDVDILTGTATYKIWAMFDELHDDGFATIEFETLDEFRYNIDDLENNFGSIYLFDKRVKEKYSIVE